MKISTFAALAVLAFTHNQNVLAVGAATKETETITIGTAVFEIDLGGGVTGTRTPVALTASAVAAAGTLTLTENAAATNTVTIGTTVYTLVAAADAAGEVTIGASASATIDNLIAAINGDSNNTAHALVTAAAGAGDTMVITAKVRGTGGNTIATTDTLAGTSAWGAVTMAAGADPSAANSITAIVAAINSVTYRTGVTAVAITGGVLVIDTTARGGTVCTETLSGSGNAWLAATTYGQSSDLDQPEIPIAFTRTVTAAEAAGKQMALALPFTPAGATIQVRRAGAILAWDGKLTLGANYAMLASDGSADVEENDVVTLLAWA